MIFVMMIVDRRAALRNTASVFERVLRRVSHETGSIALLVLRSSNGFVGVRVGGDVADGLGLQQYSDAQYPPPSHYLSILDYNTVWSLMLFAPGDEDELQKHNGLQSIEAGLAR